MGVPQTVDWLRQHDDMALRIAQEGKDFAARHMTQHGRTCYTHQVLLVRPLVIPYTVPDVFNLTSRGGPPP